MKLLAVSDLESAYIWEHFDPEVFRGVDLIASCGDLKASYLSFLVTMIPAPLFYIHGNHDARYRIKPPEGCVCVEDRIVEYRGLRIGGLGGCKGQSPNGLQFTEEKMSKRIRKLESAIKRSNGIDVFITHAPPYGYGSEAAGDCDDFHKGFECFASFDVTHMPKYHLFGHRHLSGSPVNREACELFGATTYINSTGYRIVNL
ncbi:MAG: metallophosphoesterase [Oscillospiraceae bacterium]|nr:metallophosphoesterase [Oscillospiraceae bacterium]